MTASATNYQVQPLARACFTLRRDLAFTLQADDAEPIYLVEDPLSGQFYRIGVAEYEFLSLLDGRTTLEQAVTRCSTKLGPLAFNDAEAAAICEWAWQAQLLTTDAPIDAGQVAAESLKRAAAKNSQRWNPLMQRFPLGCPDGWLRRAQGLTRWLFGYGFAAIWLAVVVSGLYQVSANWSRFTDASRQVIAPENWLVLALAWLALKAWHEAWHAFACQQFGGTVREAGVSLLVFVPIAYVDVTSAWRFPSKWHRILVSAAGMAGELFVAGIAAWVWSRTSAGVVNHVAHHVVLLASVTTLLFNANPLMRFDGYYIFSDWLNVPNLAGRGRQFVYAFARRYLLGIRTVRFANDEQHARLIACYGVAALVWQFVVTATLLVVATTLFRGAGVALVVVAGLTQFAAPLLRFGRYLWRGNQQDRPKVARFLLLSGSAGAMFLASLIVVPWPGAVSAPAIVEYAPLTIVRAESPGFVQQLLVRGGDSVAAGQLLLTLENRSLQSELAQLELSLQQTNTRARAAYRDANLERFQMEQANLKATREQLDELRQQVAALEVRAPVAGQVIARDLPAMVGSYIETGRELLLLGDERAKELRLSISQDDVDTFSTRVQRPVSVTVAGTPLPRSQFVFDKLIPNGTQQPPHGALAANHGGSLPVRPSHPADQRSGRATAERYELIQPRFEGVISLPAEIALQVRAGQRAFVGFRPHEVSIGQQLLNAARRWLRSQTTGE